jgi:hypothetical protein
MHSCSGLWRIVHLGFYSVTMELRSKAGFGPVFFKYYILLHDTWASFILLVVHLGALLLLLCEHGIKHIRSRT